MYQNDPLYICYSISIHKMKVYWIYPQKCGRRSAANEFVSEECNDSNFDIKRALKCFECSYMMLLDPERCNQYRDESFVNIETFPKPSGYEVLDEAAKSCIVVYQMSSRRTRCLRCMIKTFSTKENSFVHSKTSSLADTFRLGSKLPKWSWQNLLACHHKDKCVRIQKVPYHFCSEHAAILSSDSSKSIGRDATITYTQRGIPVGIWPPQMDYILMSYYKLERVSDLPPFYSNKIALVQFDFARSTFEDCASCKLSNQKYFFLRATNLLPLDMFGCIQQRLIFLGYVLKNYARF